ncbi:DUF4890 domain-containing protein [Fibrella sp. HMF5335]|uniref:DUF4890 domain-containing protein n=1 Tax=Fibrella rubiginis TaxID=2817060 RepID=A0A939K7J2_9BACT|nr:DUF4890 domain-containing protein [Fibrella rubiginis]MBO0939491.1 DUF4890 domain-containing protein [Fibrella rubiginis]
MNPKRILGGLLLTAATLSTTSLLAQTAPAATPPASTAPADQGRVNRMNRRGNMNAMGGMKGNYKAADPATRAQRMTDRLTRQLGLDDATSKKVYEAALSRDQQVDAIQKSTDDNRTKNQKLKANADQFKTIMQGILTADQFTKFQAMRQHGGRGKGGNKHDDDPGTNQTN